MFPGRTRRRYGRSNMGVLLICLQLLQTGLDRIPPVTLGTIALNVSVYLGLLHQFLQIRLPGPMEVCIGVDAVWYRQDYSRLLQAAFFHADDWHLYYNMASFLWKGIHLERQMGSAWFLYMLAVFTASTNIFQLYLNYFATYLLNDPSYLGQCAIGFSGVIFAVKVVSTHYMPRGTTYLLGFIPVNSRFACWFELVLIQILVPNTSFTGHLAGILVGLAYVQGPLKNIMRFFSKLIPVSSSPFRSRPSYTYITGTTRSEHYDQYTGGLNEDEQIRRAMHESSQQENNNYERLYPELNEGSNPSAPEQPPAPGWNIPDEAQLDPTTQDEIRRRRLARFTS